MASIGAQAVPGFGPPTGLIRRIRRPMLIGDVRVANTPPRLINILPPASTTIQRSDAVQFDVRDDGPIVRYWIAAYYEGHPDVREVVHDGQGFGPAFVGSTRTMFPDGSGSRFVIRRVGDWPAAPRLHVEAVDDGGNVSVLL